MSRGGQTKRSRRRQAKRSRRGQANLIALGAALLALTTATGLGLALADAALSGADRQPLDRAAAEGTADRLVAAEAPTTRRANVLNESAIERLTVTRLETMVPAVDGRAVRVRLDGERLLQRGTPDDGVTVRRVVLVAEKTTATRSVDLGESATTTLPRRTERVRLGIDSGDNTTVVTVRTDDRVALHDPDGLSGNVTVPASRYETTTVAFEMRGDGDGTVAVTYYPTQASKAVLEVSISG